MRQELSRNGTYAGQYELAAAWHGDCYMAGSLNDSGVSGNESR